MNTRSYDVVISGNGPAGLSSAYQALSAGKTVLLISDRPPGFVRVRDVLIRNSQRDYLRNMFLIDLEKKSPDNLDDQEFLTLLDSHLGISIKDIERFIMRRLEELKSKIQFDVEYESELKEIDMKNGFLKIGPARNGMTLQFEQEKTIGFTWVVGADGIGRHAFNTLKKSEEIDTQAQCIEISKKFHQYHVSAYLAIQRKDGKKLNLPKEKCAFTSTYNGLLCFVGLKRETYDIELNLNNQTCIKPLKITLVCEINKKIYETKFINNNTLLKYIQEAVKTIFDAFDLGNGELIIELVKPSKKFGERKDKLKLLAFKTNPTEYQLPAYETHNRYFVQLGDALINHHYLFGSGLIAALDFSLLIGELLREKMTLQQYSDRCDDLLKSLTLNYSVFFFPATFFKKVYSEYTEKCILDEQQHIKKTHGSNK